MFLQQTLLCEVVPELIPHRGEITLALGYNQNVMSMYSINRQDGRIHINIWGKILAIRPSWKIGDNVMFMLQEGVHGLFLFIEAMS